jgi:hypothetical protein
MVGGGGNWSIHRQWQISTLTLNKRKCTMKKIVKQEMREIDGDIFEVTHFKETNIREDEEIVQNSFRIIRTPYKSNQQVEVTEETKSLIDAIKNKRDLK